LEKGLNSFSLPRYLLILGTSTTEALPLLKNGTPLKFDEAQALELLKNKGFPPTLYANHCILMFPLSDIAIVVDLGLGEHTTTMWTCDLTFDYIKINASYRS
jgi:N-acetylglutamate synthase/N-acetylornithine aminotransferase